jgi:hypothetical protein
MPPSALPRLPLPAFAKSNLNLKALMNPTFSAVYELLRRKGPGQARSTKGTAYRIEAKDGNILAFPRRAE